MMKKVFERPINEQIVANLESDLLFTNGLNYIITWMDKAKADKARLLLAEWQDTLEDYQKGDANFLLVMDTRRQIKKDAIAMFEQ